MFENPELARMLDLNAADSPRQFRVFVSSTFRDMQQEREVLVKRTFPQLRRRSRALGFDFVEVDLRWGVTEEQVRRGELIGLCLREIDRCRPFFIAVLGERYGWIPEHKDYRDALRFVRGVPRLREVIEQRRSITDLEIQYGALRDPSTSRAFFYFRDPEYTPYGSGNREPLGSAGALKLAWLKKQIRIHAANPPRTYKTAAELHDIVLRDFEEVLLEQHRHDELTPLHQAARDHFAFARSRLGIHVGREKAFNSLDAHVAGNSPSLVVTGPSGVGKSALLANWIARRQQTNPDEYLLYHFVGCNADSTHHVGMTHRLCEEIVHRFDLKRTTSPTGDDPSAQLRSVVDAACGHGNWILVIDGLDKLDDPRTHWLGWLPRQFPVGLTVVLSTSPGDALEACRARRFDELCLTPLDESQRARLTRDYLAVFSKQLAPENLQRIVRESAFGNPILLLTLLNELRVHDSHESIRRHITHYAKAQDGTQLLGLVLARLERDQQAFGAPALVENALTLLWASRTGMFEDELLDLTGAPPMAWQPLHDALSGHLFNAGGRLDLSHSFIREAVETRYLDADRVRHIHQRLARYFSTVETERASLLEVPWHLACSEQWDALRDRLVDSEWLAGIASRHPWDVRRYWALIERKCPLRAIDAYRKTIEHPSVDAIERIAFIVGVLEDLGHRREVALLHDFLREHGGPLNEMAMQLCLAADRRDSGEQAAALPLVDEVIGRCRRGLKMVAEHHDGGVFGEGPVDETYPFLTRYFQGTLANALLMRSTLRFEEGDLDLAMEDVLASERTFRQADMKDDLQRCLGELATLCASLERYNKAFDALAEKELICKELGNPRGLFHALVRRAKLKEQLGNRWESERILRTAAAMCEDAGLSRDLLVTLSQLVGALLTERRFGDAVREFVTIESLCRKMKWNDELLEVYEDLCAKLLRAGESGLAQGPLERMLEHCCATARFDAFERFAVPLAEELYEGELLDESLLVLDVLEELARRTGNGQNLDECLANSALIQCRQKRFGDAHATLREKSALSLALGRRVAHLQFMDELIAVLATQGLRTAVALVESEKAKFEKGTE